MPNQRPGRRYWITLNCPEFSSLCPVTGQPDSARIVIRYVPGDTCVETKSLKFYLASYRNQPAFNEEIVNRILDDLVRIMQAAGVDRARRVRAARRDPTDDGSHLPGIRHATAMKVCVLLSGGMDSVTVFYHALRGHEVAACLSFDYGAKHNAREIPFAKLSTRNATASRTRR